MKGIKAILVMAMLVLSMVPAYTLAGAAEVTEGASMQASFNASVNVTVNATGLQKAAENLLKIVDRLANYTSGLIANVSNLTNETMEQFNRAEELRKEAWSLYNSGDYKGALETAIKAMRSYKIVIKEETSVETNETERKGPSNETIAKVEALRMNGYFRHAELIINAAKMRGINVTEVEELYNETREAYRKVVEDAMSGNSTALTEDLEKARELKKQLDEALRELGKEFLKVKGNSIASAFTFRVEMEIRALERLRNVQGINATLVEELRQQLVQLRENVTQLVREGKYLEAVKIIKEATPRLKLVAAHLRWIHKKDEMRWPVWRPGNPGEQNQSFVINWSSQWSGMWDGHEKHGKRP
ncbi:hypothetical protein [Thermococcus gorgonarius]|uniref:Uncharacterized protein n=1 Tax=Thermococcus gorgonarius TaxID=71997 RepID=A0A2Z2M9F7_THEGO|nr:hypothetical protein [Thermococcus gorgonarius]ASJ01145.1 hypothetical protein A3K92_06450 [Thermococcus gorgonarius]